MGRADGVDAHGLEPLQPPLDEGIGQRDADSGMVLVVVGALQLDVLTVEEEALIGIEAEAADAEGRGAAVHHLVALPHFSDEGVALGRGQRPQARGLELDAGAGLALGGGGQAGGGQAAAGDGAAVGVQHLVGEGVARGALPSLTTVVAMVSTARAAWLP